MAENPGATLPPPSAFGLIYEGAIGQTRLTTSFCNHLVYTVFEANIFTYLEINCGSPGILPNGWLEGSRTTLHAVVTFR